MNKYVAVATGLVFLLAVASCSEITRTTDVPARPQAMTLAGCEMYPELCNGSSGDPSPEAPGYWMGTTVTPDACSSPSGEGINDIDLDGLSDYCERLLADTFRPSLVTSSYDVDARGEPYWAAKWFPNHGNVVRVIYMFAYYSDAGAGGFACDAGSFFGPLLTLNGALPNWEIPAGGLLGVDVIPISNEDLCAGHRGDSEFITLDLAFEPETEHWLVQRAFYSAHWMTDGDKSSRLNTGDLEYPAHFGGYPRVWVAKDKHANYRSRNVCTHDGGIGDSCDSNNLLSEARVRTASAWTNVGSGASDSTHMLNCVNGGALHEIYPELYSEECFWDPNMRFEGWQPYRLNSREGTATGYAHILTLAFECFEIQINSNGVSPWNDVSRPTWALTCTDWGVRR